MEEKNIKDMLLRNAEKLAVGLVALIILIYLIMLAAGTSEAQKLRIEADEAIADIQEAQKDPVRPAVMSETYAADVQNAFKDVPEPGREPQWFAFKRPYVLRRVILKNPEEPLHESPTLRAEAQVGEVKLSWEPSEGNQNINILEYYLSRKEGDAGDWLKLDEKFGADTLSYVDRTVKPDTKYSYKVTSRAEQTDRKAEFLNPLMESNVVEVQIPFNLDFETGKMYWFGEIDSPEAVVSVPVVLVGPGRNSTVKVNLKRGDPIVVEGKDTGWKLNDFGEDRPAPGKTEKFIVIVNAQGKTKRFPAQKGEEPPPSERPEEPEQPETPPEEPEQPEEPPSNPGGGWLPPRR